MPSIVRWLEVVQAPRYAAWQTPETRPDNQAQTTSHVLALQVHKGPRGQASRGEFRLVKRLDFDRGTTLNLDHQPSMLTTREHQPTVALSELQRKAQQHPLG